MRRRNVIKSVGGLTALGSIGTSSAQSKNESASAEELGLQEEIIELLQNGQGEEVERLTDKHDINGSLNSKEVNPQGSSEGSVKTEGIYLKEGSTLHCSTVKWNDDDHWLASGWVDMPAEAFRGRYKHVGLVDDALALTWDPTEWSSVDPDRDNVTFSGKNAELSLEEYHTTYGPAASADLAWEIVVDAMPQMQTIVTRNESTGNDDIPIQFTYQHNAAYTSESLPTEIIEIGITKGALDVKLTGDVTKVWDEHVTAGPGESDSR